MEVNVRLNETDIKEISAIFYDIIGGRVRKQRSKFIYYIAAILILGGGFLRYGSFEGSEPYLFILSLIAGIVLTEIWPYIIKKKFEKAFGNSEAAKQNILFTITEKSYETTGVNSNTKTLFDTIHKVYVTKKFIVFFNTKESINLIPKHCLEYEVYVNELISLLKSSVPKKKLIFTDY
jgi:hypothetical protein